MPSYTTNYNLHKIELSDKPADITVINPNWDFIDQMLKTLEEASSGAFNTAEDLHTIEKTSIVLADSNTLNTPYKDSLTSATNGTCVVSVTENNKTLFYICNGVTNPVYIQSCINGSWDSWQTIGDGVYIPKTEKGVANGVATLGNDGKVPEGQLPNPDFDELANKYGVTETYPDADTGTILATVDDSAPVTATRQTVVTDEGDGVLKYVETTTVDEVETERTTTENTTATSGDSAGPLSIEAVRWRLKRIQANAKNAIDTGLAALAARVSLLEKWWDYLAWRYGVQTVIADGDGSTYAKIFTETIKSGDSTIGTCVTKKSLYGSTFTAVYTIGTTVRTLTTTINGDGTFTEVWS